MKKQVKLTARETAATNKDFYNLFRPIAPSINIIGKVAQVISALTEAITIWFITQSELAGTSKFVSITVSILVTLLVVAILELGGRKFLQVVTRAIVWKRLKNTWYMALFAIVSIITIGMGVISFRLSTNGIHHAFVSNVPVIAHFDNVPLKSEYKENVKEIKAQFDYELQLLKENHKETMKGMGDKYDARINATNTKIEDYNYRHKKGASWAKSHVEKYRNEIGTLDTEKASKLATINEAYTHKVDTWQSRKNKALDQAKTELSKELVTAKSTTDTIHKSRFKNAEFWGLLFSYFVGFSVILAFVCIVTTEVYRRGAGIEVEYEEEDQSDSILGMIWNGLTGRVDGFFRTRAERFAKVSKPSGARSIGFNPSHSNSYASMQSSNNLPTSEADEAF